MTDDRWRTTEDRRQSGEMMLASGRAGVGVAAVIGRIGRMGWMDVM
jgi:hypothetical protein